MAYLEAEIGGQVTQFALATDRIIHIGRSDTNDVVLTSDSASRRHAMLQYSDGDGSFYIVDLGSRNGTYVNDARIAKPVVLGPGDRIRVGNVEFIFHQNILRDDTSTKRDKFDSTNVVFAQSLITVLVADIRGFTALSQTIDAATLSEMAGSLFREAGKVLQELGAWEQKYIGDAVMAVWIHRRNEPELQDLISVFEGLSKLDEIASGLQERFALPVPVRFGAAVNTGSASVGNAGSIAFSDYTALGETVNRTFRLESSTREISRDLLIGQRTYEFLSQAAPMENHFTPFTVQMKGYDKPATAYGFNRVSGARLRRTVRERSVRNPGSGVILRDIAQLDCGTRRRSPGAGPSFSYFGDPFRWRRSATTRVPPDEPALLQG
jgi:adenylate cyclase